MSARLEMLVYRASTRAARKDTRHGRWDTIAVTQSAGSTPSKWPRARHVTPCGVSTWLVPPCRRRRRSVKPARMDLPAQFVPLSIIQLSCHQNKTAMDEGGKLPKARSDAWVPCESTDSLHCCVGGQSAGRGVWPCTQQHTELPLYRWDIVIRTSVTVGWSGA
jgi:hypothetical protein